jgi:hypothetical protein
MDLLFTSDYGDVFSIDTQAWSTLLVIAFAFGWQMAMTQPPPGLTADDWSGTYLSSSGQHVLAPDAHAIWIALERFQLYPETIVLGPLDPIAAAWAQEHESLIKEVIGFCRNGGFRINQNDPREGIQGNASAWVN